MRVAVIGVGAVGARACRQLLTVASVTELIVVEPREDAADRVVAALGERARVSTRWERESIDAVLVSHDGGDHAEFAARAVQRGAHVVSVSGSIDDVEALQRLDGRFRDAARHLVIGAGFAPGLTDLLAIHAAAGLDSVDEIHVAKRGTGGPACAREHHQAFQVEGREWRSGAWAGVRQGSGRQLCWFPEPIGALDCYWAAVADPLLLHATFPDAARVTARVAATRRDRLTAPLPMLRKPHAEAGAGAVRVEVRGHRGGVAEVVVLGAMDRPSVAAGAVAALAIEAALTGTLRRVGAGGLGELADAVPMLSELARRGVKAARFDGTSAA